MNPKKTYYVRPDGQIVEASRFAKLKAGNKTSDGGRLDGTNGSLVAAANFALGAGWGNAATFEVVEGSTDQRGTVVITSAGTGQAQATATIELTFEDGAFSATPFAIVNLSNNDNAVTTAQPQGVTPTTTSLSWTQAVLPVATKVYTFTYVVIA